MISNRRKCRDCRTPGRAECPRCLGAGVVTVPIAMPVKVRVDNRAPADFVMTIYPDGTIGFRKKGTRTEIHTSVHAAFNRARQETAQDTISRSRAQKVRRGLLSLGRK